jgi:hypothetical protein
MNTEQYYAKGFNHGYTIAKHDPDLAEKLSTGIKSKGSYKDGFNAGTKESTKENTKPKAGSRMEEIREIRNKGKARDLDKEI